MTTYSVEIWYGDQEPQQVGPLRMDQAVDAVGAYTRDMLRDTSGIRRLVIQRVVRRCGDPMCDSCPEAAPKPLPPRPDPGDPYGDPVWGEMMRSFDAWWERRYGRRRRHDWRGRP